ncbi:hypothetical protein YC2023_009865 [Brassica napus]
MDLTRKGLSRTVLDRDFIGPQISRPRGTGCCETGIFRDGPKQAMRDYKTLILVMTHSNTHIKFFGTKPIFKEIQLNKESLRLGFTRKSSRRRKL